MLDCASLARGGCQSFGEGVTLVTIDHHQDNPGDADLNLIDPAAASTTAILYDIFRAGRFPIDVQVAASLYVGLVTDTGRFQFSNTNAQAHRMAADLQDLGVDVAAVSRQVYESVPLPKLRLLGRALEHVEVKHGGALVTSWLREEDFAAAGADESHAEGIIDTLRTVRGATRGGACPAALRRGWPGDQGEPALHRRQGGRGRYRCAQGRGRPQAGRGFHRGRQMSPRSWNGQSGSCRASCDRCSGDVASHGRSRPGATWSTSPSGPPVSTW